MGDPGADPRLVPAAATAATGPNAGLRFDAFLLMAY